MNNIEKYNENIFESIKHIDQNGNEFWYARELSKALEYRDWRNFQKYFHYIFQFLPLFSLLFKYYLYYYLHIS